MDGEDQVDSALLDAVARAHQAWDAEVDPISAARAAARCLRDLESGEAAFWRGSFLAHGYIAAAAELRTPSGDALAVREDGVEALRHASRTAEGNLGAQARYLLGQVDRIGRAGAAAASPAAAVAVP